MAKKSVFSIGLDWPDVDGIEAFEVNSDASLLDADVVLFRASFSTFPKTDEYQGRPLLSDRSSFLAREKIGHWTSQINLLLGPVIN